ncbi:MAG TPA: hypothetical protein VMY38_07765 [Gemmatimonadaceae bacterium]|nr:hypothetical protein [Gemmatimonadaceae bacterium]
MQRIMLISALLVLAGCKPGETPEPSTALTKRQADSALGASNLPGARGVAGAIIAADSAAARNARIDSASLEP